MFSFSLSEKEWLGKCCLFEKNEINNRIHRAKHFFESNLFVSRRKRFARDLGGESFLGELGASRCQSLSLCSLGIIRVVSGRQFITRRVTTLARSNALLARNSVVGARIVRQAKTRGPKREVSGVRRVPEIVPHSCENYFNQISLPPRPRLTSRDSLRTFHAIKKRQIF